MAQFPALPLWTDAYLADTRHLSTCEHGAYLLLLMEAWRRPSCSLPDDDVLLARLAGMMPDEWAAAKPTVMAFWNLDARRKEWTQKRLVAEREYVAEKSRSQRDKAAKRWKQTKNGDAAAMPGGMPKPCRNDAPTPTPTPTLSKEDTSLREGAAAPVGRASPVGETDEQRLFRRAREIIGGKPGGLVTKLRKACEYDDAYALTILEQSADKDRPAEWLGGVLRNHNPDEEIYRGAVGWDGPPRSPIRSRAEREWKAREAEIYAGAI